MASMLLEHPELAWEANEIVFLIPPGQPFIPRVEHHRAHARRDISSTLA